MPNNSKRTVVVSVRLQIEDYERLKKIVVKPYVLYPQTISSWIADRVHRDLRR